LNASILRVFFECVVCLIGRAAVIFLFLSALLAGVSPITASARTQNLDPQMVNHCHRAISRASQQMGVPKEIMLAISLTETGKKIGGRVSPWPWTVNMEGAGLWFETGREALAYAVAHFERGARSFDVGCFQINYKWHHQHFRSIEEMFDPDINAMYAAKYLTELYQETGSWITAAGFYHSRTPEFASRYSKRFARHLASIMGDGDPVYQGHGSEELNLALADETQPRPAPSWPLAQLGKLPSTEILSSRPTGSLVRFDGGPSLLTPSSRPMF